MSYILDALKRAEQERQIGQLPNAAVAPMHDEYDDEPRRWPWILLAIILVAAAAAALGFWLSQKQQPSPASTTSKASAPPSVTVVSRSVPTSPSYVDHDSDMPNRVVVVTTTPQVLDAPNQAAEPRNDMAETEALSFSETKPVVEPPEIAAIELLLQPTPKPAASKPKAEPKPQQLTNNSAPPTATSPAPKTDQAKQDLPLLNEMDYAFRRTVPELSLQFHRYSNDSERSFVLIDGVRYRQGQILSAGPTLERIVDNGLVLRWQGERFIYPTGG